MATSFVSLPLNPGAQNNGGDKIVFADPYPDDTLRPEHIHRVNIPASVFWPLVWKKRYWNVQFNASIEANHDVDPSYTFTTSIEGKFLDLYLGFSGYEYLDGTLKSTNREPVFFIDGSCDEATFHHTGDPVDLPWDEVQNPNGGLLNTICPSFVFGHEQIDGATAVPLILTTQDENAVESGDMEFNAELTPNDVAGSGAGAMVAATQAWVKDDNTVDVFFEIRFAVGADYGQVLDTGESRIELVSQPVTTTASVCADLGSVTLSILGVNVTAYLRENLYLDTPITGQPLGNGESSSGTITLSDFSFSFDVTVIEEWTWP